MKNKHTVIGKIQRGSVLTLAVIAALKLSSASAIAGNIKVNSDLPSALAKSATVSHVQPGKSLNVVFILASKDPNGATEFVRRVSTPDDPLYARFLTPEQFGAAYGPTDSDYEAVKAWVTQNGLSLNELSLSRTTLSVHGTVSQFESLFATSIDNYQAPDGKIFFSANAAPSVPAEIALRLSGVIGLSNYTGFVPMVVRKPAQDANGVHTDGAGGTGPGGAYSASDLRTAYEIPTHLSPQKRRPSPYLNKAALPRVTSLSTKKRMGSPTFPSMCIK
jgi:kumamolisin